MAGKPVRRARTGQPPAPGARGYKWADATPGNAIALRHGVHSARRVDPIAAELVAGVLADRPDLRRHPEATLAWARAEARCILAGEWLMDHPPWTDEGQRLLSWTSRVEAQAQRMRERLGLDPLAEAVLARERTEATHASFDLDSLLAKGREILDARSECVDG